MKNNFYELKVSCPFIVNLQPTNSNGKILQYYGTFLTSLNLTCTKVKTHPNPVMTQYIINSSRKLWHHLRLWLNTRLQYILSSHKNEVSWSVRNDLPGKTVSHSRPSICFTNQFTGSYTTKDPTESHLRRYSGMETIKTH